ncbi:hypothetical protein FB107DRAFT_277279 [Schizophyllum commune]
MKVSHERVFKNVCVEDMKKLFDKYFKGEYVPELINARYAHAAIGLFTHTDVAAGPLYGSAGSALPAAPSSAPLPAAVSGEDAPHDDEVARDDEVAAGALFDTAETTTESDDKAVKTAVDAENDSNEASLAANDAEYAQRALLAASMDRVREATRDFEDLIDDGASIFSTSSVDSAASADSLTSYSSSISSLSYASTAAGPAAPPHAAQIAATSSTVQIASASTASLASTVSAASASSSASTSSSASAASTSSHTSAVSTPATSPSLSNQALESEDECLVDEFGVLRGPVQDSLRNRRVRRV